MMRKCLIILSFCFVTFNLTYAQREFWGSSSFGGLYNDGFIFKTDSIGDNLEIVHHFQKLVDGENISALMLGSNNKLYGVAASGGEGGENVFSAGTLFEYDLATDQFRVLEHFGPQNAKLPAVATPRAEGVPNLTEVSPGVIYVLLRQGSQVYSYNLATGVFTQPFVIPTFQGGAMNTTQVNILNQAFYKATDGFLYASTQTNSMCPIANQNIGSIIRVNPTTNVLSIRHKAQCLIDYGHLYNGFFAESDGKMYSTTLYGGANNKGVIFEYNPTSNTYTKLHDFAGSVYNYEPTSLVRGKNGRLYGTAWGGGIPEPNLQLHGGGGVLFEFDLTTNTFATKHNFTLTGQSIYDMGIFPSGLMTCSNGKLYGATQYGVFEYNPTTDEIRVAGRFETVGASPSFVQVCRKPAYQVPAASTYNVCKDAAFTLDLASANATTAVWKHNDLADATQTTPVLTFAAFASADAGSWVCTLTNECGTTVTQPITLVYATPDKPVITASGPLTFCDGGVVTLSAPTGFGDYAWSTGAITRQINVNSSGDYTVVVSNDCTSPESEPATVTVQELPLPVSITASQSVVFCQGENVVLSAPEGSIGYVWSNGETSRQISVTGSGDYTVKVNDGCQSQPSAPVTVTVKALPIPPTVTAVSLVVFCEGENVVLSAPEGFISYAWSNGETSRQISVTQTGNYTVKVNDGCESPASAPTSITVNTLPPTPNAIQVGNTLRAAGSNGSYVWMFNNIPLGEHSDQIEAMETGTYQVYSVSDKGCRSAAFASVSFVVNGTEVHSKEAVVVYPNPGQGTLHIKTNRELHGQADVSLVNATGRIAGRYSITFGQEPATVHFGDIPAGLYSLIIRKGKHVILKKIVIQ